VKEKSKGIVYMGEQLFKVILFFGPDHEAPLTVDLSASPMTGLLVEDDKLLVVGCEEGCVKILNLERPDEPKLINTIKVQKAVHSMTPITP
jgi:hypothetical protein